MANTDKHDFNYKLNSKGQLQRGSKENYGMIDLQTSKTMKDLGLKQGRSSVRSSGAFPKQEILPIDHQAAAKKLNDIMQMSDPGTSHTNFIKNLPKTNRKKSFVDHVKSQKGSVSDLKSTANSLGGSSSIENQEKLVLKKK